MTTPDKRDFIHARFTAWAARTPNAPALLRPDGPPVTFAELECRADQIARNLLNRTASDRRLEVPFIVAICLPPGPDLVAALLGILKAGGTFLALDPDLPSERLAWCLEHATPAASLVSTSLPSAAFSRICKSGGVTLLIDDLDDSLGGFEAPGLPSGTTAPAYLIYTSGSTGRPKGILCDHAAALNRFDWLTSRHPIGTSDVFCQKTSVAYVDFLWETLYPLTVGAPSAIVPPSARTRLLELTAILSEFKVSRLDVLPSLLDALILEVPDLSIRLAALKLCVVSGEPLQRSTIFRFHSVFGGVPLLNRYGCSEATSILWSDVSRGVFDGGDVPLGRPITNTRIHVLDPDLRPVVGDTSGELCISGRGLSIGDFRAEQTAVARFVVNPYWNPDDDDSHRRMYCTGDIVRTNANGELVYVGRRDRQLKLDGVRVQPEEIESALESHPGVKQCAVVGARQGERTLLVAYFSRGAPHCSEDELRAYLRRRLPSALIPHRFVAVEQIPTTASGKVDLAALDRGSAPRGAAVGEMSIEGSLTDTLSQHCRELLGLDDVDPDASFVHLGGTSLVAMQLAARLSARLALDVSVDLVLTAPSIRVLAQRLASPGAPAKHALPGGRDAGGPDAALSVYQRPFWLIGRLHRTQYNIVQALHLEGPLDIGALEAALGLLVERHAQLRTLFPGDDGHGRQVTQPPGRPRLRVEEVALDRIAESAAIEQEGPFVLAEEPPLRARLLRQGAREHVLLLTQHHIINDDRSGAILLRDLSRLYEAACHGQPNELPLPAIEYADYITQMGIDGASEVLAQNKAYWQQELAGGPMLRLPASLPLRPTAAAPRFRRASLARELVDSLTTQCRENGATLFTGALTVTLDVLSCFSGQQDIVIGVPAMDRGDALVHEVVGCFLSTLPLRVELVPERPFSDNLKMVGVKLAQALSHQRAPFLDVYDALSVSAADGGGLPYNVLFVWHDMTDFPPIFEGLECELLELSLPTSDLGLTIHMTHRAAGIDIAFEYDATNYPDALIDALLEQLVTEAWRASTSPGISLHELHRPTLDTARRAVSFGPRVDRPFAPIQAGFERQAAERPDASALLGTFGVLSYGELDTWANRIAHALVARVPQPHSLVMLHLERGPHMVAAILGALKAGLVYVPVEPNCPPAMLDSISAQADCATLITTRALLDRHSALLARYRETFLDVEAVVRNVDLPTTRPDISISPGDLAYVMFTSGTTGKPKGVMLEHGSLANRVEWMLGGYCLTASDRVLLKVPYSFDSSVGEIFVPLALGAVLYIAAPERGHDSEYLLDVIERERITAAIFVPTLLSAFLAEVDARGDAGCRACASLRRVYSLGEELTPSLANRFHSLIDAELFNVYGPTETGEVTLYRLASPTVSAPCPSVPIGRTIDNSFCVVLDDTLGLLPTFAPGEVYAGGAALARGYLGQEELTRQRFIDISLDGTAVRVYRTGDLAYALPDGNLVYLGRRDTQVKVSGVRIEITGVEEAMRSFEPILQAAIVLVPDRQDQSLAAFYTARAPVSESALHAHLCSRLPAAAVPRVFIEVERLPVSKNGKVDRVVLGKLAAERKRERPRGEPTDGLGRRLYGVWTRILDRSDIGVDDDFFVHGGRSLHAVALVGMLRKHLGVHRSPNWVYEHRTIRAQAADIERSGDELRRLVELQPGLGGTLFLVPPFGGSSDVYRELVSQCPRGLSVLGIERPPLAEVRSSTSIQEIAAGYLDLVLRARPSGELIIGGWSTGGVIAYEVACQLACSGRAVRRVYLLDSHLAATNPAVRRSGRAAALEHLLGRLTRTLGGDGKPGEPGLGEELRRDMAAWLDYVPKDLRIPTLLFKAMRHEGDEHYEVLPDNGWRLVRQTLAMIACPADHRGILTGASAALVVAALTGELLLGTATPEQGCA